jgi:hypothetical protein
LTEKEFFEGILLEEKREAIWEEKARPEEQ